MIFSFKFFSIYTINYNTNIYANIYTVVSFIGYNNPKPTPVPGLTVPMVIFTVMVAHSFISLIL